MEESLVNSAEIIAPAGNEKLVKKRSKPVSPSAFPLRTLSDAIRVPDVIYKKFKEEGCPLETAGTLLAISAKSSNLAAILSAAEAYGLISKENQGGVSYKVTETGRKIVTPTYPGEKEEAIKKALLTPTTMSRIYNDYNKKTFPSDGLLNNALVVNYKLPEEKVDLIKQILSENASLAGIISGDGIINLSSAAPIARDESANFATVAASNPVEIGSTKYEDGKLVEGFDNICFVISPIGEEDSVERKHANTMLKHLITPVGEELGLKVVRADSIDKSGIINQQILQYISKSAYCIADLSFGNANVFYELGVRHMCLLPTIQIKRKVDKLPFDVAQGRTITVDVDDPYTIMDRIESARKELREHLNKIIQNKGKDVSDDNPIRVYLPDLKVSIPK